MKKFSHPLHVIWSTLDLSDMSDSKQQKTSVEDNSSPPHEAESGVLQETEFTTSHPITNSAKESHMDCDADIVENGDTPSVWGPAESRNEDMQVEEEYILSDSDSRSPRVYELASSQQAHSFSNPFFGPSQQVSAEEKRLRVMLEVSTNRSRFSPSPRSAELINSNSPRLRPLVRSHSSPVCSPSPSPSHAAASQLRGPGGSAPMRTGTGTADTGSGSCWTSAVLALALSPSLLRFETERTVSNPHGLSDYSRSAIQLATEAEVPVAESLEAFIADPTRLQPMPHFITGLQDEETFLTLLIRSGYSDAVLQLLRYGADPNKLNLKNNTPISSAANKGMVEITRHLISHGADVSVENISGSTALIQAAHFGHYECVRLLLANGADADFINKKGTTALMRASQEGYMNICHSLILAGANVRRRNKEGMNALMLASQRGHAAMTVLLLKAGAALDNETAQGSTALMLASKRGNKDCIEELIRMGAEMHTLDDRGRSARDHATKKTHVALLPLLDTQMQLKKMRSSIRAMRNNMFRAVLFSHSKFDLRLGLAEQYARSLVHYLKAWRQRAAQDISSDAPKLDLVALSAEVQPGLASLYPDGTMTASEREAVQYKAVVSVLRSLNRDEQELPVPMSDYGGDTAVTDGLALRVSETYSELRRELGSKYLTPSESRALLDRGVVNDALYARPLRLQQRKRGISDHMWGMFWARCMQRIPMDCIILIIGYIPAPRIWNWTLRKLKNRMRIPGCQLSCTFDLFTMVDEIFIDSQLFAVTAERSPAQVPSAARGRAVPLGPRGTPIEFIGAPAPAPVPDVGVIAPSTGPKEEMDTSDSHGDMYTDGYVMDESTDSSAEEGGSDVGSHGLRKAAVDNSAAAQRLREIDTFREKLKQRTILVHIARSPQIQRHLVEHCDMPVAMMQACVYWSGLQLAVREYCTGGGVPGEALSAGLPADSRQDASLSVKEPCVRRLYLFVKVLHKWYQHRHSAASTLEMPAIASPHPLEPSRQKPPVLTREPPLCLCNLPAVCMGKVLEGPQAGRVYYACGQGPTDTSPAGHGRKPVCMYFQWASEAVHTRGPPRVKYAPFLPLLLPQEELSEAHYSKQNIGLINEGTGACVNHLVESALIRVPKSAHSHPRRSHTLSVRTTGAYDRGLAGVPYDDVYDSEDSDDSVNLRHGIGGNAAAEDTDEDRAEGEEEAGESDDGHTLLTESTAIPAIPGSYFL